MHSNLAWNLHHWLFQLLGLWTQIGTYTNWLSWVSSLPVACLGLLSLHNHKPIPYSKYFSAVLSLYLSISYWFGFSGESRLRCPLNLAQFPIAHAAHFSAKSSCSAPSSPLYLGHQTGSPHTHSVDALLTLPGLQHLPPAIHTCGQLSCFTPPNAFKNDLFSKENGKRKWKCCSIIFIDLIFCYLFLHSQPIFSYKWFIFAVFIFSTHSHLASAFITFWCY